MNESYCRSSKPFRSLLAILLVGAVARAGGAGTSFDLAPVLEFHLGTTLGQCRAAPVTLGERRGLFLAYCEDAEIDPHVEMFFFPRHRLKLKVVTLDGQELWKKELGAGDGTATPSTGPTRD